MSIQVGDVLRIVLTLAASDSNLMQNVFNLVLSGSGGPFDEDDVVDDMVDWVDDMYANLASSLRATVEATQVQVYIYDSVDDDWDEVGVGIPTVNTTGALHLLPRGVAVLVNGRTTDPDVSGKKYLGGFTEGEWTDGAWGTGALSAAAAFAIDWYTQFVGATAGATYTPGVWSPTRTNFYPLNGTVVIPTTAAYQRRRKPGVGV